MLLLAEAETPALSATNNNSVVYFKHNLLDSMHMCPLDDDIAVSIPRH